VIATNDGIEPLPKVEGVETIVVCTDEGGIGGKMNPMVVDETGV
jgi:hypothetical protein